MLAAEEKRVELYYSDFVLDELIDITSRPAVRSKLKITAAAVDRIVGVLRNSAARIDWVPHVYDHRLDPNDSPYVDLAVAANATLLVSRDNDLLRLMDTTRPEGRDFRTRFPRLRVLNPVMFLRELNEVPG